MCGRYGRRGDKQHIAEWMQTHNTGVFDEFDETNLAPSFNVAPQSFQPVARLNGETGERELTIMRWDAFASSEFQNRRGWLDQMTASRLLLAKAASDA